MRRIALLISLMLVASLTSALPAAGLTEENFACPSWMPGAGFVDVDRQSPHARDIDCMRYQGITGQTGNYFPKEPVTRWQMALFMRMTFNRASGMPSPVDQGFVDIDDRPQDHQDAINQMAQLGITSGVGNSRYGPNQVVTRSQMALFLTKLIWGAGHDLPDGADQGFSDIAHLGANFQIAINQVAQLGVTSGTGAGRFSPDSPVSREQMATFLARVLEMIYWPDIIDQYECSPTLPEVIADYDAIPMGRVCTGTGSVAPNIGFFDVSEWVMVPERHQVGDYQSRFLGSGLNTTLQVDGLDVPLTETLRVLPGMTFRRFFARFPNGLNGTHVFYFTQFWNGQVQTTGTFTVTFE